MKKYLIVLGMSWELDAESEEQAIEKAVMLTKEASQTDFDINVEEMTED